MLTPAYNTQNISLHQNVRAHEMLAAMKCQRPWNVGGHEMLAAMKCWRPWNVGGHEMLATMKYLRLHEMSAPRQGCWCLIIYDSNRATIEMLAAYKRCWRPEMLASRLLLFGLGRISTLSPSQSGWRSLSEGVASPPCSPQVESAHRSAQLIWAASLPYWHSLLYRHDLPKCPRPSNVRSRQHFDPLFWEKSKT